jgi:hypothetical protein
MTIEFNAENGKTERLTFYKKSNALCTRFNDHGLHVMRCTNTPKKAGSPRKSSPAYSPRPGKRQRV